MGYRIGILLSGIGLVFSLLVLSGCDSDGEDSNEITVSLDVDGMGSGRIQSRSAFIEIDCRIDGGEVTGQCDDVFIDTDGSGIVRLQANPETNSDFSWGTPCQGEPALCEIEFDAEVQNSIEVTATFDPKTVTVVMDPPSAIIVSVDEEIVITARAVDERGELVPNVDYEWNLNGSDVVSMVPESAESVRVTPIGSGEAIVTATVQGIVGRSAIDVRLSN